MFEEHRAQSFDAGDPADVVDAVHGERCCGDVDVDHRGPGLAHGLLRCRTRLGCGLWRGLLGRLTDGVTGLNSIIVATSPRYRYDLLFNISLAALIVLLNYLLIPRLGLTGAALSNCLALVSINLLRTWFVWHSFNWQPFDRRVFYVLALAGAAGLVAWALPGLRSPWLTLLLRGGTLTVLYGLGLLRSNWVPEVNKVARRLGLPGR